MKNKSHVRKVQPFEDFRVPTQITDESIYTYLSAIDSPRALTVWLLYSCKGVDEADQLTELECNPFFYTDPFKFRDDFAATKLLSKANFLPTSFDRKAVAMKKFLELEELCRNTNSRFVNVSLDPDFKGPNCWLLNAVSRKIDAVLGDFSAEEFVDQANWGPGVSTLMKGERVSAINKFHLENGITLSLHALIGPLFQAAYPVWDQHLTHLYGEEKRWNLQLGNSVGTVPKNSKTDRVIAVEPGINLWFQKSVGSMIRRRLRRVSINLNSQARNQRAAYLSSKTGRLATVDFSSASDSIATGLVREIIPGRWLSVMESCRSMYGNIGTEAYRWEKFSSMGNGFTFELESLIFWAAASAVHEYLGIPSSSITVYGDDVIINARAYDLFSSFSKFLGFRVNAQKSFSNGCFRESCGAYYYSRVDCKPVFLKEKLRRIYCVYKLANAVRIFAFRSVGINYGCDKRFRYCWRRLVLSVPKPLRLWTDLTLGDVGFICNFDEASPSLLRDPEGERGFEGFFVRTLTMVSETDYLDSPAVLLARLWVRPTEEHNESYSLRGRTKLRLTTSLVARWWDLGPWF